MRVWNILLGCGLCLATLVPPVHAQPDRAGVPELTPVGRAWIDSRQTNAPADSLVLARILGYEITVGRFNKSYVEYLIRSGRNDTPVNRRRHLDLIVDTYLLAGEARRLGYDEQPDFRAYMDRQIKLAVGARYVEKHFSDSLPPPSEAEIREAFRRSKETVALRHLFFRDPAAAGAAYERLRAGEDFVALANEVFQTPAFDSTAGYLGFARYADLDDAVAAVAETLRVGAVSPPVRSRFGWHILRVEERLYQPLLAESEYLYRRKGIAARLRIRRLRLEGDRFIRRLMEGLDVRVDEQAARELVQAVQAAIRPETVPPPEVTVSDEEVEAVRRALTPETVLLTYTLDGTVQAFTVADYAHWLPVLPYREVRYRPMASVGRALRNEVLGRLGLAEGLDRDPRVRETVQFLANAYLGDTLRRTQRP